MTIDVEKHLEALSFPPDNPSIWFICQATLARVPVEMRLDDRFNDDFNLAICNFGARSGKPFIAVRRKDRRLGVLFKSDIPLEHHQFINVSWTQPPTLREFLEAFNIEPDKSVMVEFVSGHWHDQNTVINDSFWWQVNVIS